MKRIGLKLITASSLGIGVLGTTSAHAQLNLGYADDYAALVGGNNATFDMGGNSDIITGNVGIGQVTGTEGDHLTLNNGIITGVLDFVGTYNYNGQNNNQPTQNGQTFGGTVNGGYTQNNTTAASAINTVSGFSSAFGSLYNSAHAIAINTQNGVQTIDAATAGTLEQNVTVNSVNYGSAYVVNINSLTLNNNSLTINDSGSTKAVVLNVDVQSGEFNNGINLAAGSGLNANEVVINIIASGEFQNAANGAVQSVTYIDENNTMNVESTVDGHVFGGGGSGINFSVINGAQISDAGLSTVPEANTGLAALFLLLPLGGYLLQRSRKPAVQ